MHDIAQIQQAKKKADVLLLLSFTPLGLIGIPRMIAGKSMHSWKFAGLLYLVGMGLVMKASQLEIAYPTSSGIVDITGAFVICWAISLHAFMVIKDVMMFWRISEDKQRFLASQHHTEHPDCLESVNVLR